MQNTIENISIIKDFATAFNLDTDSYGTIRFQAGVIIETNNNKLMDNANLRITFNEFDKCGHLYIENQNINVYLYPTDFIAKFQKFEFVENSILKISGCHPKIGRYIVKIIPEIKKTNKP